MPRKPRHTSRPGFQKGEEALTFPVLRDVAQPGSAPEPSDPGGRGSYRNRCIARRARIAEGDRSSMGFRGHRGTRAPFKSVVLQFFGTWRSPVAHLNGVQGVAGSNPAVPI